MPDCNLNTKHDLNEKLELQNIMIHKKKDFLFIDLFIN